MSEKPRILVLFHIVGNKETDNSNESCEYNTAFLTKLGYDVKVVYSPQVKVESSLLKWCESIIGWKSFPVKEIVRDYEYVIVSHINGFVLWDHDKMYSWLKRRSRCFWGLDDYGSACRGYVWGSLFIWSTAIFERFYNLLYQEIEVCQEIGFDRYVQECNPGVESIMGGATEALISFIVKRYEFRYMRSLIGESGMIMMLDYNSESKDLQVHSHWNTIYTKSALDPQDKSDYMWCCVFGLNSHLPVDFKKVVDRVYLYKRKQQFVDDMKLNESSKID